jgi:hypothetical protein
VPTGDEFFDTKVKLGSRSDSQYITGIGDGGYTVFNGDIYSSRYQNKITSSLIGARMISKNKIDGRRVVQTIIATPYLNDAVVEFTSGHTVEQVREGIGYPNEFVFDLSPSALMRAEVKTLRDDVGDLPETDSGTVFAKSSTATGVTVSSATVTIDGIYANGQELVSADVEKAPEKVGYIVIEFDIALTTGSIQVLGNTAVEGHNRFVVPAFDRSIGYTINNVANSLTAGAVEAVLTNIKVTNLIWLSWLADKFRLSFDINLQAEQVDGTYDALFQVGTVSTGTVGRFLMESAVGQYHIVVASLVVGIVPFSAITAGVTSRVAITVHGDEFKVYVDDVLISEITATASITMDKILHLLSGVSGRNTNAVCSNFEFEDYAA